MRYLTFKGRTQEEAQALFDLEKKYDPELKEGRLIKQSVEEVSSFMGLKKEKIYKIIIGVPEHIYTTSNSSNTPKPFPLPTNKQYSNSSMFSPIEKAVIKNKKVIPNNNNVEDTLFAIKGITKVAEQLSQLEQTLPKKNIKTRLENSSISKEYDMKKEFSSIRNEVKALKELLNLQQKTTSYSQLVNSLQENKELPNEQEIYKQHIHWIENYLTMREFSLEIIKDIISHLKEDMQILSDKNKILKSTEQFLRNHIPIININLDNYVYGNEIILVGPTGVGKTSTIVKLAAHLSFMRKKKFRFISIDRYKIGGETQLEKLSDYMNSQFHLIHKQEEFFELLSNKDSDFTFIDTAGKGPKETIAIQELSHWISIIGHPIDIHLVVSATTKFGDLEYICDTYKITNYNHIIVTKLDETKTLGSIISLAYKYQKPFSFVTDGQEIPQDFEIADIYKIIKDSLG